MPAVVGMIVKNGTLSSNIENRKKKKEDDCEVKIEEEDGRD